MNSLLHPRPHHDAEPHHPFNHHRRSGALLIIGLFTAGMLEASAQSWETASIDLGPGGGGSIVCESTGAIHATGGLKDATGTSRPAILKSTDRGGNWLPEDTSSAGSGIVSFQAITTARVQLGDGSSEEQLFAIAITNIYVPRPTDVGWIRGWGVVRSRDLGATWQPIGAPYDFGYWGQVSTDLAVDKDGNVYVVGYAIERVQTKKTTTDYVHWLVLRGSPNTTSSYDWSKVADLRGSSGGGASASGVTCIGSDVFVCGSIDSYWQVQKSSNFGATWTSIDQYQLAPGFGAGAYTVTKDSAGNLFAAGWGTQLLTSNRRSSRREWIVRQGTQSGFRSAPIDVFSPSSTGGEYASGVLVDGVGAVQVFGFFGAETGSMGVREGKQVNGTWSWNTTDEIGMHGTARISSIASDATGNLFSTGSSHDASGNSHWIVRRRLVTPTP